VRSAEAGRRAVGFFTVPSFGPGIEPMRTF
jgi:hypothetical protein